MVALKDRVTISNGSACTSSSYAPSHVLKAMGMGDDEANTRHYVSNAHGYLFNDLRTFFRLETVPAAGFPLNIWLIPAATQPASR